MVANVPAEGQLAVAGVYFVAREYHYPYLHVAPAFHTLIFFSAHGVLLLCDEVAAVPCQSGYEA